MLLTIELTERQLSQLRKLAVDKSNEYARTAAQMTEPDQRTYKVLANRMRDEYAELVAQIENVEAA